MAVQGAKVDAWDLLPELIGREATARLIHEHRASPAGKFRRRRKPEVTA